MKEHVTRTSLTVSPETVRKLEILRNHLNSPKSWIIARLVDEELKRVGIVSPYKKPKLEVRAQ